MAVSPKHLHLPSSYMLLPSSSSSFISSIPFSPHSVTTTASTIRVSTKLCFSRRSIVRYNDHSGEHEEDDEEDENLSFEEAVSLFNKRDYYKSHDALEALWIRAEEPARTLFHGILQCAVGFHHLFNNVYINHKGAMMELGEGVCKLRKMNFENGPFQEFERDVSAVLEFVYQTQLELAACSEDMCLTMDQSDRSYQLLGGYAAGESIYSLETMIDFNNGMSETSVILFSPSSSSSEPTRVKLPTLAATDKHLIPFTGGERS
ncbi:unnamed protein product [Eruca vesicaria subsp. sativa]|uniref:DUF309 domain-containing protein n=1 Tax=Eruca vesicaria subsp. sativa TaxID=29727 RepID=A0ABC8L2M2_ERUVS|nr:unnamed protein product [Eruca vesicaria subsp. sativa]